MAENPFAAPAEIRPAPTGLLHLADIPGLEGLYAATRDGKIWSYARSYRAGRGGIYSHNGRWLTPTPDSITGYPRVRITPPDENARTLHVHRLVALAWLGPPPRKGMGINHLNGIKTDCRIENLEWCSPLKNNARAIQTGLSSWRARRLTDDQAADIRRQYQSGTSALKLSREFRVSPPVVRQLLAGKTYKERLDG